MIRKNLQKKLALALAAAMLATTFVGCGQTEKEEEKSSTPESSKVEESKSEEAEESSEEVEEEEVKWSGTIRVNHYTNGPLGEREDMLPLLEIEKILKERYGYDVTIEPVYIDPSDYTNQLNLLLMSGDAPDLFQLVESQWATWQEDELVATWSEEVFRENAPAVAAFFDAGGANGSFKDNTAAMWKATKNADGEMAGIPAMNNVLAGANQPTYNKVWLDNLGKEVPQTLDEFVDLMYAFTYDDPDGNGKDDTYGMSSTMVDQIFAAYGSWPGYDVIWGVWVDDKNGGIVSSDIAPGNKEALEVLAKLYADGCIDPEFVTGEKANGSNPTQPFATQRIGVTGIGDPWHFAEPMPQYGDEKGGAYYQNYMAANPEGELVTGPSLEGPYGDYGTMNINSWAMNQGVVINSSVLEEEGKLEVMFGIMNAFASDLELAMLSRYGIEGVHYDMNAAGGATRRQEFAAGTDQMLNGIGVARGLCGVGVAYMQEAFEIENNTSIKLYAQEVVFSKGERYTKAYQDLLTVTLPSESEYNPKEDAKTKETFTKIITGELPLSAYDDYVKDYLAKGGQVILDEANEWYKSQQ